MSLVASITIAGLLALSPSAAMASADEPASQTGAVPDAVFAPTDDTSLTVSERGAHLSSRDIDQLLTSGSELPPNCWFQYVNGVCIAVICMENGQLVILPEPCSAFGG
jgi:hypothetical protein